MTKHTRKGKLWAYQFHHIGKIIGTDNFMQIVMRMGKFWWWWDESYILLYFAEKIAQSFFGPLPLRIIHHTNSILRCKIFKLLTKCLLWRALLGIKSKTWRDKWENITKKVRDASEKKEIVKQCTVWVFAVFVWQLFMLISPWNMDDKYRMLTPHDAQLFIYVSIFHSYRPATYSPTSPPSLEKVASPFSLNTKYYSPMVMKHTTTYKMDLETLKLFLCKFKIYPNKMPENIIKKLTKKFAIHELHIGFGPKVGAS